MFEAECGDREVILIQKARYGRMRIGRCVRTDFGFVGCYADVIDIVAMRCSGRRRCSLRVPDPLFEKTTGCNAEFKSYFEVAYTCVPGLSLESVCYNNNCVYGGDVGQADDTIIYITIRQMAILCTFVSKCCIGVSNNTVLLTLTFALPSLLWKQARSN